MTRIIMTHMGVTVKTGGGGTGGCPESGVRTKRTAAAVLIVPSILLERPRSRVHCAQLLYSPKLNRMVWDAKRCYVSLFNKMHLSRASLLLPASTFP